MRNATSGLVTLALAGIIAGGIAVGCSADGSTDIPGDSTADPGTSTSGTDPASTDPGAGGGGNSNTTKDAGSTKDSGSKPKGDSGSAGVDAGPPPPNPGDKCTSPNSIFTRSCGNCGTQEAVCLAADGGAAVSDYSACTNEVVGGCKPGTTQSATCGLCGTQQKICQNNCMWAAGTCTGEPVGACSPGAVNNSGAGCSAGTFRQQTCGTDCKEGNFTMTCGPYVNSVILDLPNAVNGVVSHTQDLESVAGKTFSLDSSTTCPASTINADYPSDYVEVDNNTGKAATVTVYQSATPGGSELDTLVWVYAGNVPPANDTAKKACSVKVSDSCASTTLCGGMNTFTFGSIAAVPIPAGGKILVYSGGYASDVTGPMMINVRVDTLK
jgi:hypothetical protein